MLEKECPKCKTLCELDDDQISLGTARCKCGARLEVISGVSETATAAPPRKSPFVATGTPSERAQARPDTSKTEEATKDSAIEPTLRLDWRSSYPFIFVLVSLACAYGLWRAGWIWVLLILSIVATFLCWLLKREFKNEFEENKKAKDQLRYFFFDKSLEFFAPLTLVVLFYKVLSWIVGWDATDSTTVATLQSLQNQLDLILSYLSWIKFKPWIAALIILSIIVLDLCLSIFFSFKDLAGYYKQYSLWSKRLFTLVFLLCCFTFFGEAVGEKRAELSSRLDQITEGYSKVREKAADMLTDAVQEKLYTKVKDSFPSDIKAGLDYLTEIDEELRKLNVSIHYANAASVEYSNAAKIIEYQKAFEKKPPVFSEEPIRYSDGPRSRSINNEPVKPAPDATVERISKSLGELERPSFKQRFASLIRSSGAKQLFCQFPKSFTSQLKSSVFAAAVDKYPIIEPIVDVFIGTFDKAAEGKVNEAADRVSDAILNDRVNLKSVVDAEAQKIADATEVKVSSPAIERARRILSSIKNKLAEMRSTDAALRERTKAAVTEAAESEAERTDMPVTEYTCLCGAAIIWGPTVMTEALAKSLCREGAPC